MEKTIKQFLVGLFGKPSYRIEYFIGAPLDHHKIVFLKKCYYFNLGFGGLGQMGAIMAKVMGNKVTVISTSNKKEDLFRKMGLDDYIISKDPNSLKSATKSMDIILDTIGADHEIQPYLEMLKKNGTFVVLGIVSKPFEVILKTYYIIV